MTKENIELATIILQEETGSFLEPSRLYYDVLDAMEDYHNKRHQEFLAAERKGVANNEGTEGLKKIDHFVWVDNGNEIIHVDGTTKDGNVEYEIRGEVDNDGVISFYAITNEMQSDRDWETK